MKLWTYLVVLTGLMLFLSMAGLPSGTNDLKKAIGYSETTNHTIQNVTISAGGFYNYLFGAGDIAGLIGTIALSLVGAVILGFVISKPSLGEIIFIQFILIVAIKWIQTLTGIMNYAVSLGDPIVTPIIVLIFLPLTVGFIIATLEFFRGTD